MQPNEYALIVAGGSGSRMQSSIPKQFIEVGNKPILMHTIEAFYQFNPAITIILVLPISDQQYWIELCNKYNFNVQHIIKNGGKTRFESVKNGLKEIEDENGIVAIHDGVRPLISQDVIKNSFESAYKKGNAIAAVPLKDSIRELENNASKAVDRSKYMLIQTPQTFMVKTIKEAYNTIDSGFTDDASVAENAGIKVHLIEGDYKNIKITTKEDLLIAEAFIRLKK
jgi:2-C-methyl-D-erythritol 4-phosphate cytidylyltransferase